MKYAAALLLCLTPVFAQVSVPQPPPSPGLVCMQAAPDGITCTLWVNAPHSFGSGIFGVPSLASFFRAPAVAGAPAPLVPIAITITPAPTAVLVQPPVLNSFTPPAFSFSAGSLNLRFPGVAQVQIGLPPSVNLPALIPLPLPSINFPAPQTVAPLLSGFFTSVFSHRPPIKP